jgi:peptidoglycan LD-endopeptidase LytH
MRKLLLLVFLAAAGSQNPIADWKQFISSVHDQTIPKEDAKKRFPIIYSGLKNMCRNYAFQPAASWRFPLEGYGIKDIGAGGFKPNVRYGSLPIKGYDFYDGNLHGGHPAYDIFIRDRDGDMLDDATRKPVTVLAPVDLLILSVVDHWEPGSEFRGGCHVWALDPLQDQLLYFAHLKDIQIQAGAFAKAGSAIGTVGRTGTNAWPAKSPTHLHFMVLQVNGSNLIPYDYKQKF